MYIIFDNWKMLQMDNNWFCTYSTCSSLWCVKYNHCFCNENTNFKYALETKWEENEQKMIRLRAEETKEHDQTR